LGDDDKIALKEADTACKLKKDDAESYCIRSMIEQRMLNLPKALADIDTAIKINPYNFYFEQKAKLLIAQGKWIEAEQCASTGIRMGISPHILLLRADIASHLRHWPIVIQDAKHAAYLKESTLYVRSHAFELLIAAYGATKQPQELKRAHLEALRINPNDMNTATRARDYFTSIGDTADAARVSRTLRDLKNDLAD
jgi:tetratricopeptide (TPR) repeat protein